MLKYRDSSEQNFFFLIKIQSLVYIYIYIFMNLLSFSFAWKSKLNETASYAVK